MGGVVEVLSGLFLILAKCATWRRSATLVALALVIPSIGFILELLVSFGLSNVKRIG
jgi:hypothetical protein